MKYLIILLCLIFFIFNLFLGVTAQQKRKEFIENPINYVTDKDFTLDDKLFSFADMTLLRLKKICFLKEKNDTLISSIMLCIDDIRTQNIPYDINIIIDYPNNKEGHYNGAFDNIIFVYSDNEFFVRFNVHEPYPYKQFEGGKFDLKIFEEDFINRKYIDYREISDQK